LKSFQVLAFQSVQLLVVRIVLIIIIPRTSFATFFQTIIISFAYLFKYYLHQH